MMDLFKWLAANYQELLSVLGLILVAAEGIVRLTPTKKDDGFLERVGGVFRKLMDLAKIPNLKKKEKK